MRKLFGLAIVVLAVSVAGHVSAAEVQSVTVDGTAFVATFSDGRVMPSTELVRAVLTINTSSGRLRLRIDAVERDPDAVAGPIWLHSFSVPTADGTWRTLCDAGPDGRRQGFPLAFRPRAPDGAMEPAPTGIFELVCTAGARGKSSRHI